MIASTLFDPTMGWLADTFIYTGLLIVLVLFLRRPVSRYFGPNVAYMLWALPLVRFLMPPFVLPASMAPEMSDRLAVMTSDSAVPSTAVTAVEQGFFLGLTFAQGLVLMWLVGAAVLLIWRARAYHQMRRDLLQNARPAGVSGDVRLIETSHVDSPVAFGVFDKVIALPFDFMAQGDVKARDLAIEHELSHHRGHDLLANIIAQPLLALHWFNPLAWLGWRAMRTDQEAACDARVVSGRARSEKANYAEVIAGFSVGPRLALVAPMACPVLGEKSIIHRLRSLSMNEVSAFRRRIGFAAIVSAGLALPLTASISYAAPAEKPDAEPSKPLVADSSPEAMAAIEGEPSPQPVASTPLSVPETVSETVNAIEENSAPAAEPSDAEMARAAIKNSKSQVVASLMPTLAPADDSIMEATDDAAHPQVTLVHQISPRISISVNCEGQPMGQSQGDENTGALLLCKTVINGKAASNQGEGANKSELESIALARIMVAEDSRIPLIMRQQLVRQIDQHMQEVLRENQPVGVVVRKIDFRTI